MPVPFTENTGKKQRAGTPFPAADMSIPAGRPDAGHPSPHPIPLEPVARRPPGLVFPGDSRLSLTQPPPSIHPSTGRSRCDVIGGASALHFCRQQQHAARADTHERHKIRCGSERGHHLIPPPTTLLPEHSSLRASSAMKSPDAPSLQRVCSVQDARSRTLIGRSWANQYSVSALASRHNRTSKNHQAYQLAQQAGVQTETTKYPASQRNGVLPDI